MDTELENKLGKLLKYLNDRRANRVAKDPMGFNFYLDDPQIQNWVTGLDKAGRLNGTAFVNRRPDAAKG